MNQDKLMPAPGVEKNRTYSSYMANIPTPVLKPWATRARRWLISPATPILPTLKQ